MILSEASQRIGDALVAEGLITAEQLSAALDRQHRAFGFPLGQIVSIMFRVPIERVDEINARLVILPLLPAVIRDRLEGIALRDKFSKNLVVSEYIREYQGEIRDFEVKFIEARAYGCQPGEDSCRRIGFKRFLQTLVKFEARLLTVDDDMANHAITFSHDSDTGKVVILENDDELKTTLYFTLRNLYNARRGRKGERTTDILSG